VTPEPASATGYNFAKARRFSPKRNRILEKADRREQVHEHKRIDFLRGFLKDPKQVGSVIPSSRFMERRIIEFSEPGRAGVVVELGPGTGGTTRALLQVMAPEARLLAVDLDPSFARIVASIDDERLMVEAGSAADIGAMLGRHGLGRADLIVSGIPFSTMPPALGGTILEAAHANLAEGGRFVAYQFRAEVARLAEPVFGAPARSAMVTLNVPPMRIWRWEKTR